MTDSHRISDGKTLVKLAARKACRQAIVDHFQEIRVPVLRSDALEVSASQPLPTTCLLEAPCRLHLREIIRVPRTHTLRACSVRGIAGRLARDEGNSHKTAEDD